MIRLRCPECGYLFFVVQSCYIEGEDNEDECPKCQTPVHWKVVVTP